MTTPTETPTAPAQLHLEDLHEGQRFISGEHALDVDQIRAFAGVFDPQPFHLDAEAAKETLFGGLAASGWHTAAITMRLMVAGGMPLARGLIGAGADIRWPRPTRPGDVLHLEAEVLSVVPSRSRPDRGIATFRVLTLNQQAEIVQDMTCRVVVWRRGAG